jgi:hypothetical protein
LQDTVGRDSFQAGADPILQHKQGTIRQQLAKRLAEDAGGRSGLRLIFTEVDDQNLIQGLVHLGLEVGLQAKKMENCQCSPYPLQTWNTRRSRFSSRMS